MALTEKQKRFLRQKGHGLKPVVIVGDAGASDAVVAELDHSLEAHELLKVRVNASDRDTRQALIDRLCDATGAELVQRVGHVAVLYRPAAEPRLKLPADR
ncbi:MAG TPA: ribosome assembly RNA-binding protein YhbY [Gammaproteobacteria bacterium]|nr:ribosome assembly RNA-binding protein YhbY [Gammaproteobacteria bacterium]